MKFFELLEILPPLDRERMLGRIEGMELAMRICRNRSVDVTAMLPECNSADGRVVISHRMEESSMPAALIRMVQVQIGNGTILFPEMSEDERDEINRIY